MVNHVFLMIFEVPFETTLPGSIGSTWPEWIYKANNRTPTKNVYIYINFINFICIIYIYKIYIYIYICIYRHMLSWDAGVAYTIHIHISRWILQWTISKRQHQLGEWCKTRLGNYIVSDSSLKTWDYDCIIYRELDPYISIIHKFLLILICMNFSGCLK